MNRSLFSFCACSVLLFPAASQASADWEPVRYFVFAPALIVALLAISLLWSRSLKRQVRIQTAELRRSKEVLRKAHEELEQRVEARTSELFHSRQMLQQVLDNIPQRIFWKDRNSVFLGCNKPLAVDCGYANPGDIIGKTDYETASAATAASYRADDQMVIETGLSKLNYEEPQIKPDGSPAWLRTSKMPLRDKDGAVMGMLGMYEDITERKQMEQALRESEEKHRAVVDAFDGQIYTCSPDYRIEFMNKRLIERTGYDATGVLCYTALHDRNSACPWCVKERVQRGETVRWEVQSPKDNRWYYVVNTPIYHADGTISKQAMILDITERKQMEQALAQKTAELVRSNKELEHFASIASHDLRAPLSTIGGFAHVLYERYTDKLDEKAQRALTHIVQGTRTMEALITDLLAYARVTSGGQTFKPVHCNSAINTALANIQADTEKHRAITTFDPLPMVRGDETQFVQLFQNLIGNAITYSGEQPPRIHVSAKRLDDPTIHSALPTPPAPNADECDSASAGCGAAACSCEGAATNERRAPSTFKMGWLFSVTDNGIGIDAAHAEKIFEIFTRLHHDRKYTGTGIGLAICKKIVERHGGRIWVESEPGKGSTFYFTIPD